MVKTKDVLIKSIQNLTKKKKDPKVQLNILNSNCESLKITTQALVLPTLKKIEPALKDQILVSILLLNRDGLEHVKTLIPALFEHTKGIVYELIVVDNASSDKSVHYLRNCGFDLNLTIIENTSNESFSRGNNVAASYAKGKYLVLLNNNVEPLHGWLHHLIHVAETQDNIGSVGSRLIYPFKESFENSCTVQHAGIAFRDEVSFFRPYNQGNGICISAPKVIKDAKKSALSAACLLVTAKVFQVVGGLDEDYDYGFEDVDFGLKLVQAGYQNYYCASSVLFHYEFGTQKHNVSEEATRRLKANMDLLRKKWFSTIKQSYWKEKLYDQSHLFADTSLKVAIAVTDCGPNITAGDYFTAQEIANYLEEFGWTILYLSRLKGEWYQIDNDVDVIISLLDSYDINNLPKHTKRLTTIAWTRNWFDRWCNMACFNDYDIVFASSSLSCEYIRKHSQQEPLLLPIATNIERFIDKPNCKKPDFYKSDICFTGSYWDHPRDIMQALSKTALKKYHFYVFGANWEKFTKFKPYLKGFIVYDDIPHVYHHTKIVIDDANHVTKPYGSVNSRVFDALISGALVITNGMHGSVDLFNGELPYYTSSQDLDKLLEFYLNDDKARINKVNQLKKLILKKHTYKHRAETIRDTLGKRFMLKSISIKVPAPNWEEVQNWGDFHMAVLLKQQLETQGYRVQLQVLPEWDNDEGMECDVALIFRGLSRYTPKSHQINLMWNISHPDKVSLEEYEEYDTVFIASELWAKEIAKQVSVPVETMLQCTDPERFHVPNIEDSAKYHQQLLFVGNSRKVERKILKNLIPTEYDLAVYGNDWEKLIPKQYIKGNHIPNDQLYLHYGSADILLNDHWDTMREKGFISNRIFDGLACGAFILTDKVKKLGELKKYVQVYETKEELKELLEYYLKHPEERLKKSQQGMEHVVKNHIFKERAKHICLAITTLGTLK